ncbi:hypothetical protein [Streptomyces hawaiiensis]|uniref:hypothetical protein n=1 Tax=Streptomyces hawaiiensis TaxID=67305 RepID=UPI00365E9B20
MFTGESALTGPARRGAKPPVFPVAAIDDPALPEVLAERAAARADEMDADTVNGELSVARKAIGWWPSPWPRMPTPSSPTSRSPRSSRLYSPTNRTSMPPSCSSGCPTAAMRSNSIAEQARRLL